MPNNVDLLVRGAKADFQAAVHQGACISDVPSMCSQIEDMIQSIALGLNGLTDALRSMSDRIDHIESWIQAQQTYPEVRLAKRKSRGRCTVAR